MCYKVPYPPSILSICSLQQALRPPISLAFLACSYFEFFFVALDPAKHQNNALER